MEPEKDIFEQWKHERESLPLYKKVLNSIEGWWKFEARYYLKDFKIGIKNIWYWFPLIWKDRNWDHIFILDLLSHKIKSQSKYIGERGIYVGAERDAEIMMTCVRLIESIKEDFYGMEYTAYEKTKNWFEEIPDRPGYSTWKSIQLEESFNDYFAKYPLIYKRVMNGEGWLKMDDPTDKHLIASNIAHINHERAKKLLFKILEERIEHWWD